MKKDLIFTYEEAKRCYELGVVDFALQALTHGEHKKNSFKDLVDKKLNKIETPITHL